MLEMFEKMREIASEDVEKMEEMYNSEIKPKIDNEINKKIKEAVKNSKKIKKPRRGRTPRVIFNRIERSKIKDEFPEMDKKEITKELARRWKNLKNSECEEDMERLKVLEEESKRDLEEQNRLRRELGIPAVTSKKLTLYHCWLKKNTPELKSRGLRGAEIRKAKSAGWAQFKANASEEEKQQLLNLFNSQPCEINSINCVESAPSISNESVEEESSADISPHSNVEPSVEPSVEPNVEPNVEPSESESQSESFEESKNDDEIDPDDPFYDARWYKDDEEEPICDILDPYNMCVAKLKWHLKKRGLKTTGRKKTMAKRLAKEMDFHHAPMWKSREKQFDRHTYVEDRLVNPKHCVEEKIDKEDIIAILNWYPPLPNQKPSELIRLVHTERNILLECVYRQKDFIMSVYRQHARKEYMTESYFVEEYGEEYYYDETTAEPRSRVR
jgi:hypothetical protein